MRTILNYFRDPIWQFIGVIIAVIVFLISLYIPYLPRDVKALQVVILANTSLVEVEESIARNIKIFYDNLPIDDLTLIQVSLENSGNQSIREEDYSQPIQLVFPPEAEVIEAAIVDASPENVGLSLQVNKNTVTASNTLLNPDDRVIIRLLVTDLPLNNNVQPFRVKARIADVKDISVIDAIEQSTNTSSVIQKEGIDRTSFLFGCIYGTFAAAFIAIMLRNYLEAQLYSTFRNRNLDRFSDATQPTLTPTHIDQTSRGAMLSMIMWRFLLIVFIGIVVVGLFYILVR